MFVFVNAPLLVVDRHLIIRFIELLKDTTMTSKRVKDRQLCTAKAELRNNQT